MRVLQQSYNTIRQLLYISMKEQKSAHIFGVRIDDISSQEVEEILLKCVRERVNNTIMIYTPNPEILLAARNNTTYASVLNSATWNIPDGFGIRLVSSISHTVTGVDTTARLLEIANEQQKRVCWVIREDGRSQYQDVVNALQQRVPNGEIRVIAEPQSHEPSQTALNAIEEFQPDILIIGLGFPYQEEWAMHITNNTLIKSTTIKVIIAVGGTIDFFTGSAIRAPRVFRVIRMEWLWRLLVEPRRRMGRIFRAVILFPFYAIGERLFSKRVKKMDDA